MSSHQTFQPLMHYEKEQLKMDIKIAVLNAATEVLREKLAQRISSENYEHILRAMDQFKITNDVYLFFEVIDTGLHILTHEGELHL